MAPPFPPTSIFNPLLRPSNRSSLNDVNEKQHDGDFEATLLLNADTVCARSFCDRSFSNVTAWPSFTRSKSPSTALL
jgi:hypothetical protein